MGRDCLNLANLPLPVFRSREFKSQQRRGKQIEQMQRQSVVAASKIASEIDAEGKLAGLQRSEILLNQFVQFIGQNLDTAACF